MSKDDKGSPQTLSPTEVEALLEAFKDREGDHVPIVYRGRKIGIAVPVLQTGELSVRVEIF